MFDSFTHIIFVPGDYEILDTWNITDSGNISVSLRGVSVPTICPAGSYCPEGTRHEAEYLCPAGTFSNSTGLYNYTQCTPCTPGMYCQGEGKYWLPSKCVETSLTYLE